MNYLNRIIRQIHISKKNPPKLIYLVFPILLGAEVIFHILSDYKNIIDSNKGYYCKNF